MQVPDLEASSSGLQQNVTLTIQLVGSQVQLWWPVGLGNQTLYQLQVVYHPGVAPARHERLGCGSRCSSECCCCQSITKDIGFRRVELVRDPIPDASSSTITGESFYFRVNGVPVYAKGANVIPLHFMAPMVSQARLTGTLEAAHAANMNMLRIWGGGRYQVRWGCGWRRLLRLVADTQRHSLL
jgi:beta-mannosidase